MIRIHNFARGARGARIAWLCEEMGLAYEPVAFGYPPPPEYMALNPLGNVPFLEDEGGVAIHESVAILLYLARRYGPTPLLPADDDPRLAAVLQLTVFSEASFGAGVNTLLTGLFGAPEADKDNWSIRTQRGISERHLAFLDGRLAGQDYLVGDFSLADIAVGTGLGVWKGALGGDLPKGLAAYRERLAARPAYQKAFAAFSA